MFRLRYNKDFSHVRTEAVPYLLHGAAVKKQLVLWLLLYPHSTDGGVCVEATHSYIRIEPHLFIKLLAPLDLRGELEDDGSNLHRCQIDLRPPSAGRHV